MRDQRRSTDFDSTAMPPKSGSSWRSARIIPQRPEGVDDRIIRKRSGGSLPTEFRAPVQECRAEDAILPREDQEAIVPSKDKLIPRIGSELWTHQLKGCADVIATDRVSDAVRPSSRPGCDRLRPEPTCLQGGPPPADHPTETGHRWYCP